MTQWAQPGADAILAGGALPTTLYIARHTGNPGDAGTANAASDTRRIAVDMGPLASPVDGVIGNETYGEILNATHDEDITHITYWGAGSGGVCYFVDALAATLEIEIGQTVAVAIEQAIITFPLWT